MPATYQATIIMHFFDRPIKSEKLHLCFAATQISFYHFHFLLPPFLAKIMAEAAREEYGGYSGFTFVDKVSDALNCPICLCPMRDTVQTACGHRFCRSCLLQTFR